MREADWPAVPGTYVLLIRLSTGATIRAGGLRDISLPAGDYAYSGSARGPGGLRARIGRHLRQGKPMRWHIDYLTAVGVVTAVLAGADNVSRECAWVRSLLELPGCSVPVRGFGSSDCRESCPAHLVRLPDGSVTGDIAGRLRP